MTPPLPRSAPGACRCALTAACIQVARAGSVLAACRVCLLWGWLHGAVPGASQCSRQLVLVHSAHQAIMETLA